MISDLTFVPKGPMKKNNNNFFKNLNYAGSGTPESLQYKVQYVYDNNVVYTESGQESSGSLHDGQKVILDKGTKGDLVFTAAWEEKQYTVKYDLNGAKEPARIEEKTGLKWGDVEAHRY